MHCPKCRFEQEDSRTECARCGVIFARLAPQPENGDILFSPVSEIPEPPPTRSEIARGLLFTSDREPSRAALAGRTLLFAFLFIWGWRLILSTIASNYVGESFMHLVNLPFHEAGHVIFGFFGDFLRALGGTLGQLLIPAICLVAFLFQTRDPFAASVALWWLGESFLDVGPYMADARSGRLLLLGGVTGRDVPGYHDWENVLGDLNLLAWDQTLAGLTFNFGRLLMLAALAWGGAVLWRQWRTRQETIG